MRSRSVVAIGTICAVAKLRQSPIQSPRSLRSIRTIFHILFSEMCEYLTKIKTLTREQNSSRACYNYKYYNKEIIIRSIHGFSTNINNKKQILTHSGVLLNTFTSRSPNAFGIPSIRWASYNNARQFSTASTPPPPLPSPDPTPSPSPSVLQEMWNKVREAGTDANEFIGTFDSNPVIQAVAEFLKEAHNISGLPWWAFVIASSLTLRLATYPLRWGASKQVQKLMSNPAQFQIILALQSLLNQTHDREARKKVKQTLWQHSKSLKISQAIIVSALLHIPIYLIVVLGLRLAALTDPTAAVGGILWFEDLTKPDPLGRLVLITFILALVNLELGNTVLTHRFIRMVQWLFIMSIVPLQSQLPQAVALFSSTTQTTILGSYWVKRWTAKKPTEQEVLTEMILDPDFKIVSIKTDKINPNTLTQPIVPKLMIKQPQPTPTPKPFLARYFESNNF